MNVDCPATGGELTVYTIGHSNRSQESFVALLKQHGIEVLVDVRSSPYSRYVRHFDREPLKRAVVAAGMKYLYLGRELGGRPADPFFYNAAGHVRYDLLAASPQFQVGIERLLVGISKQRVALMCNEEDPTDCHRRLLVGRVLRERSVTLLHIRGDGRVQSEADLERKQDEAAVRQQEFAFAAREKSEWRSTRSVSPASRPKRSSAR